MSARSAGRGQVGHLENAIAQVIAVLGGLEAHATTKEEGVKWAVSERLKKREQLVAKVERKRRVRPEYSESDVTDVAGVRVVVESAHYARQLAAVLKRSVFEVDSDKSEDFSEVARRDGYRGIHLILKVKSLLPGHATVPVELQIRSILQHQWAELSRSEFYKALEEIPPALLTRMRALSEALHAAEVESEELRRNRALDACQVRLRGLWRKAVLERLGEHRLTRARARAAGVLGLHLMQWELQARRALVGETPEIGRALRALEALTEDADHAAPDVHGVLMAEYQRIRRCLVCLEEHVV